MRFSSYAPGPGCAARCRSLVVTLSDASRFCVEPKVCRFSGTLLGLKVVALAYAPGPGVTAPASGASWCDIGVFDLNAAPPRRLAAKEAGSACSGDPAL